MAILDADWPRLALEASASAMSAIAGLVVGAWRWGRKSALHEVRVRNEYIARIDELKAVIAKKEREYDDRLQMLIDQFQETFAGMRRQIDADRLRLEQEFVRKDDFKEFREEYRADMRDLKRRLDERDR